MAQLKDLIVTGATRLIGNAYAGSIQITTLNAPTAAGGTTYGPGTNGYVLKSNGSSVYWGSDNNSVTGVKGNAESSYRTGQVNLTAANVGAPTTTGTGASGTWAISISGNAATASKLGTARTISLTGSVTGSGSFDGSGNLSIATTTNHHHNTLTVGNKTYNGSSDVTIEIADLGLASTTTFIGLTSTNLSNGSTTNPVTITVGPTTGSVTATNGNVVMEADSGEEYIWSGNKWNLMGLASSWALANHIHGNITNAGTITSDTAKASGQHLVITDSNNKICRSAITLGTATNTYLRNDGTWATPTDTNKYHKTGSWSGLTYTATAVNSADELKFTVPSASTSAAGAVQLSSATNSTSTTLAATASAVKAAYDLANGKVSRSGDTMTGMLKVKGLKGTSGTDYGEVLPDTAEEGQIFFQLSDNQYELPDGGTTGQVLVKNSNNDRDVTWGAGIPSGGDTYQFLRGDGIWSNGLTQGLYIQGNMHQKCLEVTRGTAYSGDFFRTSPEWTDSAGTRLAQIEYHKSATASELFMYVLGDIPVASGQAYSGLQIHKALNATGNASCLLDANAGTITGAVWNDYAEYRKSNITEPGRCVRELGDGSLVLTNKRLERGCEIVSDTFGFAIGKNEECQTPTACAGRVLAYFYEDIEIAKSHIGWPVCSGPEGTVSLMTEEEELHYPSRIIGTISEVPSYEIWHAGGQGNEETSTPIKVNGRIWIRIR